VLKMLVAAMTEDEILAAYPDLEPEDSREALFAASAVSKRELPVLTQPRRPAQESWP
jgi:uncharacterized protein (DUF433 family)